MVLACGHDGNPDPGKCDFSLSRFVKGVKICSSCGIVEAFAKTSMVKA